MSRYFFAVAGLTLAVLLAGCATPGNQGMLTYETNPEGAQLFEGGQAIGTAPVTRTYAGDGKAAQITTPEVTAVWPSGAKASFWTKIDVGSDRVTTIERPAKAPNLQADLDNAAKFKLAREQAQAREKQEALRDQARNSARCKAQQSGQSKSVLDDCN
ncbi:hypothetical protein [Roseateles saccharophilus]|uniref:Lipoprotein n=1 Tax=Roseateles saccharophilus TaxID=304 RepID=A0A4R3VA57_ROSSA|nr:hypothetical protein [Roseateles saccharophilus]MDG0835015.1 hypothetical protein [Roseateles saccharophilus]TCV00398.1 hypothetical protein EV671_1008153 [Roseateles saccharophilus]